MDEDHLDADALPKTKPRQPSPLLGRGQYDCVRRPDGTFKFGEIGTDAAKAAGCPPGEIRLQYGFQFGQAGFGARHIESAHGEKIGAMGYDSIESYVLDIATNYTRIHAASSRQSTRRLLFMPAYKTRHPNALARENRVLVVEYFADGPSGYWAVVTGYEVRPAKNLQDRLWERSEPA